MSKFNLSTLKHYFIKNFIKLRYVGYNLLYETLLQNSGIILFYKKIFN